VSSLKRYVRREIIARRETLVGTVVSDLAFVEFDASTLGAESWVVDVNIGGNRLLRNVLVKAGERGRFYAQRGQTVALRRNAQGRFDVVAPADRVMGSATVTSYDINGLAVTNTTSSGFALEVMPFEFYMGDVAVKGNPSITFNQIPAANDEITRAAGSFVDDGFAPTQSIRIWSPLNSGVRTVATVTATTLGFAGDVLVDEGPLTGVTMGLVGGSLWDDGSNAFPKIQVIDLATGLPV
jgi:hypothetical protein